MSDHDTNNSEAVLVFNLKQQPQIDSVGGNAAPQTDAEPSGSRANHAKPKEGDVAVLGDIQKQKAGGGFFERVRTVLINHKISIVAGIKATVVEVLSATLAKWVLAFVALLIGGIVIAWMDDGAPSQPRHRIAKFELSVEEKAEYPLNTVIPAWCPTETPRRAKVLNGNDGAMEIHWSGGPNFVERWLIWFRGEPTPIDGAVLFCNETGQPQARLVLFNRPGSPPSRKPNRLHLIAYGVDFNEELFSSLYVLATEK